MFVDIEGSQIVSGMKESVQYLGKKFSRESAYSLPSQVGKHMGVTTASWKFVYI